MGIYLGTCSAIMAFDAAFRTNVEKYRLPHQHHPEQNPYFSLTVIENHARILSPSLRFIQG
jgi:hypothetical protein